MEQELLYQNVSKVFKHLGNARWNHIEETEYKPPEDGSWKGVTRREIIGQRGESPLFHVRYFEIEPGGYSTFEHHQHEHVVMVQKGRGVVQLGCEELDLELGDIVYVAPHDPHQFRCPEEADEPFGFYCIVNAERDRPEPSEDGAFCSICV